MYIYVCKSNFHQMDSHFTRKDDIYGDLEGKTSGDNNHNHSNDGASSTNTETPSEPWFDDQDLLHSSSVENRKEVSFNRDYLCDFASSCGIKESELKGKELDLYSDLINFENEEKQAKSNDSEFADMKKELEKLRESVSLKNTTISELSAENTNLKKNICSLYKTAKSEIEHKDTLLREANRKLDNLLFRKNIQNCKNCRNERYANSNVERKRYDTKPTDKQSDESYRKRKRQTESPNSSYRAKEYEPARSSSKMLKNQDTKALTPISGPITPKSNYSKLNNGKDKTPQRVEYDNIMHTSETMNHSSNSRDMTETSNLFFNLLPEPLKQSFYEYEQTQVVSLNRLKQSFLNEHFKCDNSVQFSTLESTPKRPRVSWMQPLLNKNYRTTFSGSTTSLLTPNSDQNKSVITNNKLMIDASSRNSKTNKRNDCKVTKLMQQNIHTLYTYRRQKVPFLDKRKFGLLRNNKKV